jgi:hypothetical protein
MPVAATPNPQNLYLGAGEVWLDRFDPVTFLPTGAYRHLGDVDSLEINTVVKALEKKSSMDGARATYANVIVSADVDVTMKLAELDPENFALAMLGSTAAWTQAVNATVTAGVINNGVALVLDRWYDLGFLNPHVTDVKQGTVTLVAGTDYVVDLPSGMIKLISTGPTPPLAAVTVWDGSAPALTGGKLWYGLGNIETYGAIRYRSAANQITGAQLLLDIWNIQLMPEGNLQLIAEQFGEATLKGKVQLALSKPVGQQYYRVRQLPSGVYIPT